MWAGPTPRCGGNESIGLSQMQGYSLRSKAPSPTQGSSAGAPVLGRGVPMTADCEDQRGLGSRETEGCWNPWCPLKVPGCKVTHHNTCPKFQGMEQQLEARTNMHREELNCLASGPGMQGQLSPVPVDTTDPLLSSPFSQLADAGGYQV